jgi:hypothetical protein
MGGGKWGLDLLITSVFKIKFKKQGLNLKVGVEYSGRRCYIRI